MAQTTVFFVQVFVIWAALGVGVFIGFLLCALFAGGQRAEFERRNQALTIAARIKAERKAYGLPEWKPEE